MVSVKEKAARVPAISILDENPAPKNAIDFKKHPVKPRVSLNSKKSVPGTSCAMEAARNGPNGIKDKAQAVRNTAGKCDNSAKTKIRRNALADVSNLNGECNYRGKNQLSNNPKIMKEKLIGSSIAQGKNIVGNYPYPYKPKISLTKPVMIGNALNKTNRENLKCRVKEVPDLNVPANSMMRRKTSSGIKSSHVSGTNLSSSHVSGSNPSCCDSKIIKNHGAKLPQPRLSLTQKAVMDANSASRKPVQTKATHIQKMSKQQITVPLKQMSELEICADTKPCEITKAETSSSSCDDNEPIGSHECEAEKVQSGESHCSTETVKLVITRSKRNRRKSYTSSLVARSEIMGDDATVVKDDELPIIDDNTNPLEAVEFVDDIYRYYWTMEEGNPLPANYMTIQADITPKMRGTLINWLIEVHHKYQLMQETLFLMVEVLDRVLSALPVKMEDLQMIGLTAILLASKYEDYWHPKIDELISISANTYSRKQILDMEKIVLRKLRFRLNFPTPYVFMLRFLKAAQSDKKLEHLAFYLIELCLMEYEALKFRPSLLCASAIYVARCTLQLTPQWTGLLTKHTTYNESHLKACADMILGFQRAASSKPTKYTYVKFLSPQRSCVATIKSLKCLPQ